MVRRVFLLVLVALGGLLGPSAAGATIRFKAADRTLLTAASLRLSHEKPAQLIRWLRRHHAVRSVALGLDGRTVDIRFRDGMHAAILPPTIGRAALPARLARTLGATLAPSRQEAGRALVLEPFATELNLGIHDGDGVAADLQSAGFQVDQVYDGAVTVAQMASLSNYDVVYIVAHVGVNPEGEGVVATGQQVDDDPSVVPLIKDDSVMTVEVAGTSQQYYGILSNYIRSHLDAFPSHSLVLLNGCGGLRASLVWQAFTAKGVGALAGWDNESMARDESLAGDAFFHALAQGQTVSAAIAAVQAAGYGTSVVDGQTASFGYLGDGSLTLQSMASPPTATPLPTPTGTPAPTKRHLDVRTSGPLPRLKHPTALHISVRDTVHHHAVGGAFVVLDAHGVGLRQVLRDITDRQGNATFGTLRPVHSGAISVQVSKAGFYSHKIQLRITA